MPDTSKLKILFLCTGNSCRSQMAEAWTNFLRGDAMDAYSAGVRPHGLDNRAVKAMAEAGIDISGARSKDVSELMDMDFGLVVTVCDNARENCPFFPGSASKAHVGFDDPPYLAAGATSEDQAMGHYRRVRDEIKDFVMGLPGNLEKN